MKCKVCGEEDSAQFYESNKSTCKRCLVLRSMQQQHNTNPLPTPRTYKPHKCKSCGEANPDLFYPANKGRCKRCASAINNHRYHSLGDMDKEAYKDRSKTWHDDNILLYRWRSAKSRAIKKGLEFSITEQYIQSLWHKQDGRCYYTGQPMKHKRDDRGRGPSTQSVSIDRLDSTKGYVEGNVVLCCAAVNVMKGNTSLSAFKELIVILSQRIDEF